MAESVYVLLEKIRTLTEEIGELVKVPSGPVEPVEPVPTVYPPLVNNAKGYEVGVWHALADTEALPEHGYFRCVRVRHLSADENRGKHNVYVDVVDESGQRVRRDDLRIRWRWLGQRYDEYAKPAALDKPDSPLEFGHGNIDLSKGVQATVWIGTDDATVSDEVGPFHTYHRDERASDGRLGNSIGHHSFYAKFVWIKG